jgi:1-deoxy-D-xylulose 5-phosphate reductoisomerase
MTLEQPCGELFPSALANAERTVTLLGATGSIGASTLDLIKRERDRYRVEAVSANKKVAALEAMAPQTDAGCRRARRDRRACQ